jgi:hypothetical protein
VGKNIRARGCLPRKTIEKGLKQTSVMAVLIGETTANRKWVNYEIITTFERGNGIMGIHINQIRDKTGQICSGE